MALQDSDRQKLDGIVSQMQANQEPDANIQAVVNDFKQKYNQSESMGQKIGDAAKVVGNFALKGIQGASNIEQIPSKIIASTAGDGREYAFQPEVNSLQNFMGQDTSIPSTGINTASGYIPPKNIGQGMVETAGRTISDPLTFASPLLKMFGIGEKIAQAIPDAITGLTSKLTGISSPALKEASTSEGRQALQTAASNQGSAGTKFADVVNQYANNLPEVPKVNEALSQANDIDIRPTLTAFDKAKAQSFGPMGSNTPGRLALNTKLDVYKNAMSGTLPSPQQIADMDFSGNLQQAQSALADPQNKWGILKDVADKANANAKQAVSASSTATSNAVSSGSQVDILKNLVGTSKAREMGDMMDAVSQAKSDASTAQDAFSDAQAKLATGQITAQDAAKAKSVLDAANKNYQIADAANQFSQGKSLDDVSRSLVDDHGLSGNDLTSVLDAGRNKVGSNSFTPNFMMAASDFKKLREALDQDIDFSTPEGQAVDQALKIPRDQMKNDLISAAPAQYAKDMQSWSNKLDMLDQIRSQIGNSEGVSQDARSGNFLKTAAKEKAGGPKSELLKMFDQNAGTNNLQEANQARLASQFGEDGKPAILPTGSHLLYPGLGFMSALEGHPSALAIAGASSPYLATHAAIPAADALSVLLKGSMNNSGKISSLSNFLQTGNK